jgi:glyoxylase-like metal-dependent hydrolase (beta-lactamase superfamily II)
MQIKLFKFNPVKVNTYIIYDETKEAIIIDCGAYTEKECMKLQNFIDSNNLQVKYLINTHLHFDHVLGNYFIYKTYGLKSKYHVYEEIIPDLKTQADFFKFQIDYHPISTMHHINEKDTISFGNTILEALLTAGHSPGSLSFYCKKNNCIFTGDALFYHSIGRTDLWNGNKKTLTTAIKSKILTLPKSTKIFPGHGQSSSIEEEKIYNPYLQ